MTAPWPYRYRATPVRAVDGDTLALRVDVGLRLAYEMTVRLARCNAAEKTTVDGQRAIGFVEAWIARNADDAGWLAVTTQKNPRDKYGRWLAEVESLDGTANLTNDLIANGFAVPYDGHGKKPVPDAAA